eukprot:GHRR01006767.1.p1 GENE.GHRR01006767.1~~GHRR01006767.1.p1  ORF type:complete len:1002 (+),score=295.37 GHRR01006767.1:144-3149(+)
MPVTAGALITSVCINGSVGLVCFSFFAILRRWRVTAKLYKPKRYIGAENLSGRKPAPITRELPAGLLSWIKPVWCYSEPDVIDLCGLDVAVFFRVLQLGVRLFTFITVWCLLVVMPVNYLGGYLKRHHPDNDPNAQLNSSSSAVYGNSSISISTGDNALAGFSFHRQLWGPAALGNFTDVIHTNLDLLTLSNVPPGSRMMWVHLASVYVITLVALKLLWDLSQDVAFKRAVFLSVQGRIGPGSSVLVSDVPGLDWGTPLHRFQLSWVRYLLPARWLRRGFDYQQLNNGNNKPGANKGQAKSVSAVSLLGRSAAEDQQQQLQQPLLSPDGQDTDTPQEVEVTQAVTSTDSKGSEASRSAPDGSCVQDTNGSASSATATATDGAHSASSSSRAPPGGEDEALETGQVVGGSSAASTSSNRDAGVQDSQGRPGRHMDGGHPGADVPVDGREVGPPVVKDVWEEAVEVLRSNGGDVKDLVESEMRRVYGSDSVAALVLVHDTQGLDAACAKYCKLQEQFEDVLDWYQYRLPHQQQVSEADVEAQVPRQRPTEDLQTQQLPEQQQQRSRQATAAADSEESQEQERALLSPKRKKKNKQLKKRKTVVVVGARYGSWGLERFGVTPTQVDALEFYPAVLQQLLHELRPLQEAALQGLPRSTAVVTFRQQLVATLAAASLHSYDETAWTINPAPAPQEIVWSNCGLRAWELSVRQLAVWAAFWVVVLFYAPVVALIQAPVNMDNLKKIPVLASLLQLPLVSSLVQGFLPSLVLLTFLAVLPSLLQALICRGGLASITAQDAQLTLMYFLFQLFAVFIFSFVSGTALSQLQALLDDPHRIISLLGVSAPQQASFFSTYILLLGLSRTPLQLLRLPQLAWYLFRLQLADSPRQRRRLWADQQQMLGRHLPLHTLVLLLGLVFCVASPLIAPVTLLYFASNTICQRYQWLYVYKHPYEGAGTLWKQVFTQAVVAVYFFVAVMGCLLGIKRFEAALLLLPLAAAVLGFHVLVS